MATIHLYLLSAAVACAVTAGSLPLLRKYLGRYFSDVPSGLKKHAAPVPVLGGTAVMLGLSASLIFIRLTTDFPSGTLHSLRGILLGGGMIYLLGAADDAKKPAGLSVGLRLGVQSLAALTLMYYGVRVSLFDSPALSYILTFFWTLGITNAFNLLDISDGLCVSQAFICALGLWVIALPSEFIYVNFCACALLGACAGFWPYNHSRRLKTFLGDGGSTLLGFVIAALAMGTGYSEHSDLGFLAPLLILAVPVFDTGFVSLMRILKGKNPLKGSNDHAALRLLQTGISRRKTLWLFIGAGLFFNLLAFAAVRLSAAWAAAIYAAAALLLAAAGVWLARIRING